MTRPVTENILRAIARESLADGDAPALIAVAARPEWDGPVELEVDGTSVRIHPCVSALAFRERVLEREMEAPEDGSAPVEILLTDQSDRALGEELRARLWRRRVQHPNGWENLKQLFRVDTIDAQLANQRWLVDLLVEVAPTRGYPPPSSGILTQEEAWRAYLRHGLGITSGRLDLAELLLWASTADARAKVPAGLGSSEAEVRSELVRLLGPVAGFTLDEVVRQSGARVLSLGLVADALWGSGVDPNDPPVLQARGRFEGRISLDGFGAEVAEHWGRASVQALDEADKRGPVERITRWISQAEDELHEISAVELAGGSSVLREGFDQRMLQFGRALKAELASGMGAEAPREELPTALRQVEEHRAARQESGEGKHRAARARMALRLVRWLHDRTESTRSDLAGLAQSFVSEGAWVDLAWHEIAEGDDASPVADAYHDLRTRVAEIRQARDRAFGAALGLWASTPNADGVLPIEEVLGSIVAPLAEQQPVLLLVLDGLSEVESLKLEADLGHAGWRRHTPQGAALPPVIAAFPTVTEVSRTTLLTGTCARGNQRVEADGFAAHPDLGAASPKRPPRLFHKKDLKLDETGQIAIEVRDTLRDADCTVVGVVVNAVDDHLAKGSQLRLADGLDKLKPLRMLLETAAETDRVVVVASDHGHVLEYGTSYRKHAGSGERWRPATGEAAEDEVRVIGPRVVLGGGEVIMPATDQIRYMPAEKRGYHGGATPQEVVCPLSVLFPGGMHIDGWEAFRRIEPAWWAGEERVEIAHPPVARPALPRVEVSGQSTLLADDGSLSTGEPTAARPAWVQTLLETPRWRAQRDSSGGATLDDETAARVLTVLRQGNGRVPAAVLAEALAVAPTRARSMLTALKRLVNVDGYAVLKIESDGTGILDVRLLAEQFGIDP